MSQPTKDERRFARWRATSSHRLAGVIAPATMVRHVGHLARVVAGAAIVSSIGLLLASGGASVPHLTMEKPFNPASNIAPNPNFLTSGSCSGAPGAFTCQNPCVTSSLTWPVFTSSPACTAYILEAINNARATENIGPMVLPSNWDSLTVPEQMLVVTDLERVARGYPAYLGLNAALDGEAASAAAHDGDPAPAANFRAGFDALGVSAWGGSWAEGFNVLAGDYVMFYDDGWGGSSGTSNIACTSPGDLGCWAHRDELLGSAPHYNDGVGLWCATCEMGAGYTVIQGHSSYAQLIELPAGSPPPMVFTWQSELGDFPSGAIGTVRTIALARVAFSTTSLRATWSIAGAQDTSLAVIYTFPGSTCARLGRVVTFRYVAAFNIRRSTVTVSGAGYFRSRGPYSAVVRVYTPNGSMTSDCVPLGRS